jgi:hypothetical protein
MHDDNQGRSHKWQSLTDIASQCNAQMANLVVMQHHTAMRTWLLINVTFAAGFACGRFGELIVEIGYAIIRLLTSDAYVSLTSLPVSV